MEKIEKTQNNVLVDKDEGETLQGFIYEQADKFFVDHIPFETIKDLPSLCKYLWFMSYRSSSVDSFYFWSRQICTSLERSLIS